MMDELSCPICGNLVTRIGPDSYTNDVWRCPNCRVNFSSGIGVYAAKTVNEVKQQHTEFRRENRAYLTPSHLISMDHVELLLTRIRALIEAWEEALRVQTALRAELAAANERADAAERQRDELRSRLHFELNELADAHHVIGMLQSYRDLPTVAEGHELTSARLRQEAKAYERADAEPGA